MKNAKTWAALSMILMLVAYRQTHAVGSQWVWAIATGLLAALTIQLIVHAAKRGE